MIAAALAFVGANRRMLTLLLALGIGAAFYVQWQAAALDRSRAATNAANLLGYSDTVCAALGVVAPAKTAGKADRDRWATACLAEAQRLGAIEEDLAQGTADSLLSGLDARMGKEQADALLAAALAKRAAEAAERLEDANAAVENDVARGAWAGAINDAAGLRQPGGQ